LNSPHRAGRLPLVSGGVALVAGLGSISFVTAIYVVWLGVTNPTIVALSFLLVVLTVATISTRSVAIGTSLMAFLCFNYFFLPPIGTWAIADAENWVALFTLLAVSIIASHLSTQVRQRAMEATARRDELARLFDLTCDILLTTETKDGLAFVAGYVARRFGLRAATICVREGTEWHFHHSGDQALEIDAIRLDNALATARAAVETDGRERAYSGHTRIAFSDISSGWVVPLRVGTRPIGLLALQGQGLEPGTRDAIAGVTAIAIERTHLLEERREAELIRRSAELKSALLAALGHDLRTPLTAVTVAANNLDASWLTAEQRHEQAEIVRAELGRLNRLFEDIVDMARIEAKAVDIEPEWVAPAEIVDAAARQANYALEQHQLKIGATVDKALVRLDPRLTSAALAHLLENAGQYSPLGSTITVSITLVDRELRIGVRDQGNGVAPQDLEHVFDRFYRGTDARQQRFGTGMGLAITRGLLAAEGGRAWAENHPDGGAVFMIGIPVESRMIAEFEEEGV
jgi:two-component system, OmpR family, sensor histidine kinase KdpD